MGLLYYTYKHATHDPTQHTTTATLTNMSYYNVYPDPTIDHLVCSGCGTATFTWLAEIFPCVVCGSESYTMPKSTSKQPIILYSEDDIQGQLLKEHGHDIDEYDTEIGQLDVSKEDGIETADSTRKRKRLGSDIGDVRGRRN